MTSRLPQLAREYWLGALYASENPPEDGSDGGLRAVVRHCPEIGIEVHLAVVEIPSRPIRKFRTTGEAVEFLRGARMFRSGEISPPEIETAKTRLGPLSDYERGISDG